MEENKERTEALEKLQEICETMAETPELMNPTVVDDEKSGTSVAAVGVTAVVVTAVIGGVIYAKKKLNDRKNRKREELKEELRKEILSENVIWEDVEDSEDPESDK